MDRLDRPSQTTKGEERGASLNNANLPMIKRTHTHMLVHICRYRRHEQQGENWKEKEEEEEEKGLCLIEKGKEISI